MSWDRQFAQAVLMRAGAGIETAASVVLDLRNCAQAGQIVWFDEFAGHPQGYVAYGLLCEEAAQALEAWSRSPAFHFELLEGSVLWIADVVLSSPAASREFRMWFKYFKRTHAMHARRVGGVWRVRGKALT